MSMRFVVGFVIVSTVTAIFGCVAANLPQFEIVLDQNTKQLEGWLSARGEWMLFASRDFKKYDPFIKDEQNKCVSLINGTDSARSEYEALDGKEVVVVGFAARYENLPDGESASDRLLSKKYFNHEVVENYCLRDLVFVVRGFRPK